MLNKNIKAVIFDWAGTIIDHGCFGPVAAFQNTFTHFGIEASVSECRLPMGLPKRAHIKAMIENVDISERILKIKGRNFSEDDIKGEEGRMMLANSIRDALNAELEELEGFGGIEKVHFTSLVLQ